MNFFFALWYFVNYASLLRAVCKLLIDELLHSLQELLNHIKDKIAASLQVSVEFRSVNLLAKEVH